ncbi:Flagellar FliJ protein [Buchnera aphidicola (Anoecia corni)]|uniref:Flagellar FliJ protein n=1 Tax=Buchnera aphidicola (Anoecia corni) TaxID=2994477 RepID=A0AAT9IG16_9GAMM
MLNSYHYIKLIKKKLKNNLLQQTYILKRLKKDKELFLKRLFALKNYNSTYNKKFLLIGKNGISGKKWENFNTFLLILEKSIKSEKNKLFLQNQKINDILFTYTQLKQKIKAWDILEKNRKNYYISKKNQFLSANNDFFLQLIQIKKKLNL